MTRQNVDRLFRVLSEILSEKHGIDIKIEAVPKSEVSKANNDAEVAAS